MDGQPIKPKAGKRGAYSKSSTWLAANIDLRLDQIGMRSAPIHFLGGGCFFLGRERVVQIKERTCPILIAAHETALRSKKKKPVFHAGKELAREKD